MFSTNGTTLVAVLCGLAAGCLLGTQPSVNGFLGKNVAHPLQATVISFSTGTVIVLVLTLAMGIFPPKFLTPPQSLPWWAWCGGAIGVVMVTSSLFFVPRVGSLIWFAAIMTGQTGLALTLDHFGWLGNPKAPLSPLRILGTLLLIAGVMVIVQARRLDQPREPSNVSPKPEPSVDLRQE